MFSAALLDDGERLPHFAGGFEIAEQQDGIGEIADIDRGIDIRAHEANLGYGHDCRNAPLAKEGQQLVQLHSEKVLAGHGIKKPVEAVNDQELQIVLFDQLPNFVYKLAGRELCGIDLAKQEFSGIDVFPDIHAEAFCPDDQSRQNFIEGKESRAVATLDG